MPNREKARKREAEWRSRNLERLRLESRKRYDKIRAPLGYCTICTRQNIKLYKDHCHITGKQREYICNNCNLMLGHAKDNIFVLENAIDYLIRHGARIGPDGFMDSRLDEHLAACGSAKKLLIV